MRPFIVLLLVMVAIVALAIAWHRKANSPTNNARIAPNIDLENRLNQLANDNQELLYQIKELRKLLENRK